MIWKRDRPYAISTILPAMLALLVICAVIPTITTAYLISSSNSSTLLSARAELLVDGLEDELTGLLSPVSAQLSAARGFLEQRDLDLGDPARFEIYIKGVMSGMPQVSGMGFIRLDGTMRRWEKDREEAIEEPAHVLPLVGQALAEADQTNGVTWAAPFVSLVLRDTILNPRISLRDEGKVIGILTAGVTGKRLSDYVAERSDENVTAFILYDRDNLIAYPNLSRRNYQPTSTQLPKLQDSSLDILRDIWSERNELTQTGKLVRTKGHWARINGEPYAYFYREISGYGPKPLLVGVAIIAQESFWFRWAPLLSALFGLLLLTIAVIIAYVLGGRIAAPTVQMEEALSKLERMEFNQVDLPDMARSRVTEWRHSAERLSKTARALESFNQYVPGSLAKRLMNRPQDAGVPAEQPVTVMFIDMEGFSAFADAHQPDQTAQRLNTVFCLIGPIIENHGGVIDKYTGDGLMAFWGAPDAQDDHRQRAVAAALDIRLAMAEMLADPALKDTPRLRIGMHCGPAIVGNLGFEGRVNYTLVGSTVNLAERVEQSLRGLKPGDPVVIGLSQSLYDEVRPMAGFDAAQPTSVGEYKIIVL